MTNKILFGVIGLLMASIASVGVAVAQGALFHSNEGDSDSISVSVSDEVAGEPPSLRGGSGDDESEVQVSVSRLNDNDDDEEWDDDEEDFEDDSRSSSAPSTNQSRVKVSPIDSAPTTSVKTYTMTDVSQHNSKLSCYTVVSGSVYDVTEFISHHPGGASAIISLCGVDGSSAFVDQHSGQRRPASELASYKIGTLGN